MATIKALSVKNPYAQLIIMGFKTLEIRSFQTKHRGDLLICACGGKELIWNVHNPENIEFTQEDIDTIYENCGCALGIVTVTNCRPMTPEDASNAWCEYKEGLYAWGLENPRRLVTPFPQLGQLGVYNVEVKDELLKC